MSFNAKWEPIQFLTYSSIKSTPFDKLQYLHLEVSSRCSLSCSSLNDVNKNNVTENYLLFFKTMKYAFERF